MDASSTARDVLTSNLALAGVMLTRGFQISKLIKSKDNSRAVFVFRFASPDEEERAKELISSVYSGMARVEPLHFMREVKKAREMVYSFLAKEPLN